GSNPSTVPLSVSTTSGNLPYNISVAGIPGASLSASGGTTNGSVNLNFSTSGVLPRVYAGIVDAKSGVSANRSDFTPVILTVQVPVTITSTPSGAAFTVSGSGCQPGSYATPAPLAWDPNTNCAVQFSSPQTIGALGSFSFNGTTLNGGSSSMANPRTIN